MTESSPNIQLLLPVQSKIDMSFDFFLGDANALVVESLKRFIELKNECFLFLVGPSGVGKSHLLAASIHHHELQMAKNANSGCCGYYSLPELTEFAGDADSMDELLASFKLYDFLALDDLDVWLSQMTRKSVQLSEAAELLLFNLFNYFKNNNKQLIVASKVVPSRLNIKLNDLKSRLASGLLVTVCKLNDEEKNQLLKVMAKLKGFRLDNEVSAYILKRSGRDVPNLLHILDQLDQATLIEKRKLTVPFVKKTLNW